MKPYVVSDILWFIFCVAIVSSIKLCCRWFDNAERDISADEYREQYPSNSTNLQNIPQLVLVDEDGSSEDNLCKPHQSFELPPTYDDYKHTLHSANEV